MAGQSIYQAGAKTNVWNAAICTIVRGDGIGCGIFGPCGTGAGTIIYSSVQGRRIRTSGGRRKRICGGHAMAKGWGAGPYQRRGSSAGKRDHVAWVKKKSVLHNRLAERFL